MKDVLNRITSSFSRNPRVEHPDTLLHLKNELDTPHWNYEWTLMKVNFLIKLKQTGRS